MATIKASVSFDMSSIENIFEFGRIRSEFGSGRFGPNDDPNTIYDSETGQVWLDQFDIYYGFDDMFTPPNLRNIPREFSMLGDGFVFIRSEPCRIVPDPTTQF